MPHHYNRVLIGNSRKRGHNGVKSVSKVAFTYLNSYDVMPLEFQKKISLIFHPDEQTMDAQGRLKSNKFYTFWSNISNKAARKIWIRKFLEIAGVHTNKCLNTTSEVIWPHCGAGGDVRVSFYYYEGPRLARLQLVQLFCYSIGGSFWHNWMRSLISLDSMSHWSIQL